MAKQVDEDFFRRLILSGLGYLEAARSRNDPINIDTLTSSINFIRCDYYLWLSMLVCNPSRDFERDIKPQILCINLKDKREEFLLSCSVLIHIAHLDHMDYNCFGYIHVAINGLREVFNEKYRVGFSDTDDWNELERYCRTTLQLKRRLYGDERISPPGVTSNGKNIYHRYGPEMPDLSNEKAIELYRKYLDNRVRLQTEMKISWPTPMVELWHKILDARRSRKTGIICTKPENPSCFGCVLTESYPKMKEESEGINCKTGRTLVKNRNREKEKSLRIIKARLDEALPNKNSFLNMVDDDLPIKSGQIQASFEVDSSKAMNVTKTCTEMEESKVKHLELDDTKDGSSEIEDSTTKIDYDDHLLKLDKDSFKLMVDDEDHEQVTNVSFTIPSADLPISRIKIIKHILVRGVIAMNMMVLSSWLTISKQLKYKIYSLLKLFFLTWCLLGRIIFRKSEIGENKPHVNPAVLEGASTLEDDDSTRNQQPLEDFASSPSNYSEEIKENPRDPASGERALLTLGSGPRENFSSEKAQSSAISPVMQDVSLEIISLLKDEALKTISPVQKSSTDTGLRFGVEAESHEPLGPRSVEKILRNIQLMFHTRSLKKYFTPVHALDDERHVQCEFCKKCKTQCAKIIYGWLLKFMET